MPLDAYVAATCSSTFFGSTSTSAQVDLFAREREARQHEANLRQVAHEHRRQVDDKRAAGLTVRIGRLNSTLSV